MGNLISVSRFHLAHNKILKIPAVVFQTIGARQIDISSNKVQEIEPIVLLHVKDF